MIVPFDKRIKHVLGLGLNPIPTPVSITIKCAYSIQLNPDQTNSTNVWFIHYCLGCLCSTAIYCIMSLYQILQLCQMRRMQKITPD